MKPILGLKLLTIIAVGCASLSLTGCTTAYEEQSYAEKECEELKQAARQQFAKFSPGINGSLSHRDREFNDVTGALFQSDKNHQKSALRKNYLDRCKG